MQNLKSFLNTLQSQYRCTAAKVFILNVSTMFSFIWGTVKGFLEEHTKKKIIISKKSTCPELLEMFAPGQLEEKYGGTIQNQEAPWWPPRMSTESCD